MWSTDERRVVDMNVALVERAALVALLRVRPGGLSWADITMEVVESGGAVEVWQRHVPLMLPGTDACGDPLEGAAADIAGWEQSGLTVLTILDSDYPQRLRGVFDAPPVLFARGTVVRDDRGVCVVGSRQASDRGLAMAADIARGVAAQGLSVVSGLAAGIDATTHRAALDVGGRTVAVIGTGIRRVYPAVNAGLQEEIAARGLVVSQYWPDASPRKHTFLQRNATMSGYGLATIVVEAGETSGARAQARMATAHGRPVILTSLVVDRNDWAKDMVGRAGVSVAGSLSETLDAVRDLVRAEALILGGEYRDQLVFA
jgi:DNA processing protein